MTVREKLATYGYHLTPASVWVTLTPEKETLLRSCGGFPVNDAFIKIWERPVTNRREIVLPYGTYGSSKTHDRILEHLLLSMTEPYFKCFYGRATFDLAKSEFHSSIVSIIKREGWADLFEFSEKPNGSKEISCKATGNKFKPFGCDDEDSIGKGWDDATHVMVDELNQIELYKQFGMLQSRPRKKGVPKAFTGMFNNCDVMPDHWIPAILLNKEVELLDDKGVAIERNIVEHFSLYTDNYFIDHDEYKAQLLEQAGRDEVRRHAVLTGAWGTKSSNNPFYKNFDQSMHIGHCEYNPKLALHVSFDENVNPYLPVGIFQLDGLAIYMIDEIAAKNPYNKLRWVCTEIYKRYGPGGMDHKAGLYIYGDATSRKDDVKYERGKDFFVLAKEYLAHFKPKLRTSKANPNVAMRGNFMNDILGMGYGGLTILISRICSNMIADLANTAESPDGNGKDKTKKTVDGVPGVQRWGHFTDLLDYLVCEAHMRLYQQFQGKGSVKSYVFEKRQPKNYF